MNKWLGTQRVRVLLPLIGAATFAAAMLGAFVYNVAFGGAEHHYHWRVLLFGSVLLTLGSVTGLKFRHQEPTVARRLWRTTA